MIHFWLLIWIFFGIVMAAVAVGLVSAVVAFVFIIAKALREVGRR